MDIHLRERKKSMLSNFDLVDTFKVPGSSFVFVRIDVDGLTIHPKSKEGEAVPVPIKVRIPEGKTPVLCLSTGKAQFLNLDEKVELVQLIANEVFNTEKN